MWPGRRKFVGCVRQYCYQHERKYCPHDEPNDFAYVIKVKENAPELLRKALGRLPADVVITGNYQPAEKKLEASRSMLEVCLDSVGDHPSGSRVLSWPKMPIRQILWGVAETGRFW